MAFALKHSPITLGDVLSAVWRPAALSIASALFVLWLKTSFAGPQLPILRLALDAGLYGGAHALLWALIPGGRQHIGAIASPVLDAARSFLRKPPSLSA